MGGHPRHAGTLFVTDEQRRLHDVEWVMRDEVVKLAWLGAEPCDQSCGRLADAWTRWHVSSASEDRIMCDPCTATFPVSRGRSDYSLYGVIGRYNHARGVWQHWLPPVFVTFDDWLHAPPQGTWEDVSAPPLRYTIGQ